MAAHATACVSVTSGLSDEAKPEKRSREERERRSELAVALPHWGGWVVGSYRRKVRLTADR
jgi:hypothetical protein